MVEVKRPWPPPHVCRCGCRGHHNRKIFRAEDGRARWSFSFALLATLFASSAARATDTGVREWPPQRSAIEATSVARGATERVFKLPPSSGERQRILYVALHALPRATVVMLPGGAGNIELTGDGEVRRGENFVVRTREMCAAKGYAVVIPDTIDHANLRGVRSSSEYASVVEALIRFAYAQAPGPVFLLGTSQSSIAAANGATHSDPGTLAGVVFPSRSRDSNPATRRCSTLISGTYLWRRWSWRTVMTAAMWLRLKTRQKSRQP